MSRPDEKSDPLALKPASEPIELGHCILRYSGRGWDRVTSPGVNNRILSCALILSHEFKMMEALMIDF